MIGLPSWVVHITGLVLLVSATVAVPASAQGLPQYDSRFYTIHTDLPREVAAEYAKHMDMVFAEYQKRFAGFRPKSRSRMSLYLFAGQQDYVAFLAERGVAGQNSGGMFAVLPSRDFEGLLTFVEGQPTDRTIATLQHEGFHQFAYVYLGYDLPPWANEGLAQYFEDGILIKGKMHLGTVDPTRLEMVKQGIDQPSPPVRFDELIGITSQQWSATLAANPGKASYLYAYAWSVAHFLIHAERGKYANAFGRYLELVAGNRSSEDAFDKAFGSGSLKLMERRWREYIAELEPDDLALALQRMRMIASGAAWLAGSGQDVPGDLDALEQRLSRQQYRWGYSTHGIQFMVESTDPANFTYTDIKGQEQRFKLGEAAGEMPPPITAPGLRPMPMIEWSSGDDGKPAFAVTFR